MAISPRAGKALYRGLLRATKRLQAQMERHSSDSAFSTEQLGTLRELEPEVGDVLSAAEMDRSVLPRTLRKHFELASRLPQAQLSARLDTGLHVLSLINRRVSVLERMAAEPRSDTTSHDLVRVTVSASRASPPYSISSFAVYGTNQSLFNYNVEIRNVGEESVTLVSRHWRIMDGDGSLKEVNGPGVKGQQPRIEPGSSYKYTSSVPLAYERGSMWGSMSVLTEGGSLIDAEIAPFALR